MSASCQILVQASSDGGAVPVGRPHLALVPPRQLAPRQPPQTGVDLLNPYRRATSLAGRKRDLASLWEWLDSPRPIAVRALTGRAGAGKTRIAIELIEQLISQKPGEWWAGFVQDREIRRFARQQDLPDWAWARPTLVVVDHAASVAEPLRHWLRHLATTQGRDERRPLRLLLLERPASEGGWLESLSSGGQGDARAKEFFDPLEPRRLDSLESVDQRRAVLAEMLMIASDLVRSPPARLPSPGEDPHFDRQIRGVVWEDPLYLMMAALLSVRSDLAEVLDLPRTELAMRLVDHEIERLERKAPKSDKPMLVHMAAMASLAGGMTGEQALECAGEEGRALGLQLLGDMGPLLERLHEALPAPELGIAQVVPDILAEALVLRALCERTPVQQEGTILRAAQRGWPSVIPFVLRMAQDFYSVKGIEPLNWIEALIGAGMADRPGLLTEIEAAMPRQTLALRERAVEISQLLLQRFPKLIPTSPDSKLYEEQARLLKNLACTLSASGRREEALDKAKEAVRIYEQLATARPAAFLPDLAGSLDNLACRLSALGRCEEALDQLQEAVCIYRRLARTLPGTFLPDLATSITNLADMLSDLGRRKEALENSQEAVDIYKQLARARPDAFLPYLATSIANLANMLSASGRREEELEKAREAVRIYEQLEAARPGAFLPDWAGSLDNLAYRLSASGFLDEALARLEEAVRIRGQLAQARPDAFLPDLATSLANLADMLSASGRREEALAKVQEAVHLYEQLAQARPETFLPDLARSFAARAAVLRSMRRDAECADSFEQAIRALLPLFRRLPPAFSQSMFALCRDYLDAALSAQQRFDTVLLTTVQEVLEESS